jgi:ketosteroid isomerase-like protein
MPAATRIVVFATLALTAAGCARTARQVSPERRREIAARIEREVRDAYDLSRPGVEQRLLSLYADTGRLVSAAGGQMLTSRDSLFAGIRYFWENVGVNMRNPRWVWDQMVVDVVAPDVAVMTATYHIPHLNPRGQPHVLGGAWTAVFVERDGQWKIVDEHLSDLPQTPAGADSSGTMPGMPDMPRDSARR